MQNSKFRMYVQLLGATLLIFLAANNSDAGYITFNPTPATQRALWIGDSAEFRESIDKQPLFMNFMADQTSGQFGRAAKYLGNCQSGGTPGSKIKAILCRAFLVDAYFAQGDLPAVAREELLGRRALNDLEIALRRSDLHVAQFEFLEKPMTLYNRKQPEFNVPKQTAHIDWSKKCGYSRHQIMISINGHNECFGLDLGSTISTISSGSAKDASLIGAPATVDFGPFRGASTTRVNIGEATQIKFADVTARHIYFAVLPPIKNDERQNVLGLDFATHLGIISFDPTGITIGSDAQKSPKCTLPLAIGLSSVYTLKGIVLPARINGVPVYVEADSGFNRDLFLVDPGIVANQIPTGWAWGHKVVSDAKTNGWTYAVATKILGASNPKTFTELDPSAPFGLKGPVVGVIGLPLLERMGFRVDFVHHTVCSLAQPNKQYDFLLPSRQG